MNDEASSSRANRSHAAEAPSAHVERQRRFSWVWLLALAAAALLVFLGYRALSEHGATITITFETGEGLVAHRTPVKYKAVVLGMVEDVELSPDLSHVKAHVRMQKEAEPLLTDAARFWVVRPRFGSADAESLQSGLGTLISGPYLALDPGRSRGKPARHFRGLEAPPGVRSDEPGHEFALVADRLGAIGVGSGVYYRNIDAGEVIGYELAEGAHPVKLRVFIHAPYDTKVGKGTQFWSVSGVEVGSAPGGVRVRVESLKAILTGGIAFASPRDTASAPGRSDAAQGTGEDPAPPGPFVLYPDRAAAAAALYPASLRAVTYVDSPVRGLTRGSPVYLLGETVGAVTGVSLNFAGTRAAPRVQARVAFELQPDRAREPAAVRRLTGPLLASLVGEGLHSVVTDASLLTGEKALALQLGAGEPGTLGREGDAWVLPGTTSGLDALTDKLTGVADKLDRVPVDRITSSLTRALNGVERTVDSPELKRSLRSLDQASLDLRTLMHEAKENLGPALARMPAVARALQSGAENADALLDRRGFGRGSAVQRGALRTLDELDRAARAVRSLSDELERHPESVLRGKPAPEER